MNPDNPESSMDHGERIAYIQRYNKVGWKLEFKIFDKIQLPKVEKKLISTPEVQTINVDYQAVDRGRELMHGHQSNVAYAYVEPKLKAGTGTGSQITVDQVEIESSPHKNSSKSSDKVEDRIPGENDKSTNQVLVTPYECLQMTDLHTNVDYQPADPGGKLLSGDRLSVTFGELKLKACTVKVFKINVDETEMESIPHKKSPESSDKVTAVELLTPGENDKSTNQVVVKPYECLICQKSFSQSNYLKNHRRSHKRKSNIRKKSSIRQIKVSLERRNHATGKSHVGNFCQKSFLKSNHLKNHVKSYERKSNMPMKPFYPCKICRKIFPDKNELEAHNVIHAREERPHKCPLCPKLFTLLTNAQLHLRTHTSEKPYNCRHCSKSFAQLGNVQAHERTHTGEKPYNCRHCSKSFAQLANVQAHERTHTGEKPFKCSFCLKSFAQMTNLQAHERVHKRERPYRCSICSEYFSSLWALQRHNKYHVSEKRNHGRSKSKINENKSNKSMKLFSVEDKGIAAPGDHKSTDPIATKPYKCSICLKSFIQSNYLKSHARSHEKKSRRARSYSLENEVNAAAGNCNSLDPLVFKPHKCLTCRKSFLHSNHLKNHVKSHERKSNVYKKTFPKDNTGQDVKVHTVRKLFPRVQNLVGPLLTHSGERTFKCTICHKSFNKLWNLQVHLRLHTGDRPYKCSFCLKSFTQSSHIKAHERIHRVQEAYQCTVCGGSFSRLSSLRLHSKTHTEKKSAPLERTISGIERNSSKCHGTPSSSVSSLLVNPVVIKSLTNRREKPKRCPICSKLFSQFIHLSQHLKVHTVEKTFQCPSCPRVFSCQNVLKRHLAIHKLLSCR